MADDAEMGNFGTMTTLTHMNWSPEILAVVLRGPLAEPTEEEMVAYLRLVKPKGRYLTVSKAAVKMCNGIFAQTGVANDFPTYRNAHGATILMDGAEWHLRFTYGSSSLDYSKGISKKDSVVPPRGEWYPIVGSFSFSPISTLRTPTLHSHDA